MGQSHLKPGSCLAGQEILFFVQNLNVHYNVQNSLSVDPILSQLNSVHSITSYIFYIYVSVIYH
jgi:hypothetical protein